MSTDVVARRQDAKVIGLVGGAHFISHFYQLALPPLFPLIHAEQGIGYTALGGLIGLFYAASGLCQTPAGFLVDRFGARIVLFAGLALIAVATLLYAAFPVYGVMAVLAVAAGIGNSVFHPSDYSVMSATVTPRRMGRAFSLHNFGGYLGYAAAPVTMSAIGAAWGWRVAILSAGVAGLIVLAALIAGSGNFLDSRHERPAEADSPSLSQNIAILLQTPILLCFLFFMLIALGQIGLQSMSPAVLNISFGFPLAMANSTITALLVAVPLGILAGGVIADRTARHDVVACLGYGLAGVSMVCVGLIDLPPAAIIASYVLSGLMYGIAFPSRDMLVRGATPSGSSGKVFGFAYSGLDIGSMLSPVVFGWLVDAGMPRGMYLAVALLWALATLSLLASSRAARRAKASTAAP